MDLNKSTNTEQEYAVDFTESFIERDNMTSENFNTGSMEQVDNKFLERALYYASKNLAVFPLKPNSKAPIYNGGFKIATTDEKTIREWWAKTPDANIGIATGNLSGIVVIDIDGTTGEESLVKLNHDLEDLPQTVTAITPGKIKNGIHQGKGRHFFYRTDGILFPCKNGIVPGVDDKGDGGYIVVEPSIHPDGTGEYYFEKGRRFENIELAALPKKWIDFLTQQKQLETKTSKSSPSGNNHETVVSLTRMETDIDYIQGNTKDDEGIELTDELKEMIVKYLSNCSPAIQGERGHNTLLTVASILVWGFGLSPKQAARFAWKYYNPRCEPPWNDSEWKDFFRKFTEVFKLEHDKPRGYLRVLNKNGPDGESVQESNSNSKWISFPIDSFPEQIALFIREAAESIGIDVSNIACFLLAVVSGMIGRLFCIRLKENYTEHSSIWMMLVAPSGTAKTPALNIVIAPVRQLQIEADIRYKQEIKEYKKTLLSYEKKLADWKRLKDNSLEPPEKPEEPIHERLLLNDATTESVTEILSQNEFGCILSQDELAGFFGGFDAYRSNERDLTFYLSIFNGVPIRCDRKGKEPLVAHTPAMALLGTIQPDIWKKIIVENPQFDTSGLYSRVQTFMPPQRPFLWTDNVLSADTKDRYEKIIRTLYEFRKSGISPSNPIEFPFSKEALDVWIPFFNQNATEGFLTDDNTGKTVLAKAPTYAARLALTLHVLECVESGRPLDEWPREISRETMSKAINLVEWFKNESARILSELKGKAFDIDKESALLLEKLRTHGGEMTIRELQRSTGIYNKSGGAEMIEQKLQKIVEQGLVRCQAETKSNGKSVSYYSYIDTIDIDTDRRISDENTVNVNPSMEKVSYRNEESSQIECTIDVDINATPPLAAHPEHSDTFPLPQNDAVLARIDVLSFEERATNYVVQMPDALVKAYYCYLTGYPLPDGFNPGNWLQKLSEKETDFFRKQVIDRYRQKKTDDDCPKGD